MPKYSLEFILTVSDISTEIIKNSLIEFGDGLQIAECPGGNTKGKNFKICIDAEDPTIIFDSCAQFGRIKSVKIDERGGLDMHKILIIYYSRSGNTKKMAESVAEGIKKEGLKATLKDVKDVVVDELLEYEGIIVGSPTYYGSMAASIKKLLDDSVKFHGKLDGKVAAAFASSANVGGGNETTVLDILNAMLIHGMIIQGDPQGDHYGAVAIDAPDDRASRQCIRLGQRTAKLVKTVTSS